MHVATVTDRRSGDSFILNDVEVEDRPTFIIVRNLNAKLDIRVYDKSVFVVRT